jgi:hypothetical protein
VEAPALLEALVALADDVGLRVDRLPARAPDGGVSATVSGRCRLRGETWVLLADGDPLERRVEVLASALRDLAGEALERRYLAPALRESIFPEG